jgi:hypothetical protein
MVVALNAVCSIQSSHITYSLQLIWIKNLGMVI